MNEVLQESSVRVDPRRMEAFVRHVFSSLGVGAEDAGDAARSIVRTDIRGAHTHGLFYLKTYVAGLRGGGIDPGAVPRILRETSATALVDGRAGLGVLVMRYATAVAAEKAREAGSATVLVRNSNHFGAAGVYTTALAEAGLIGIVAANTEPAVGLPGVRGPIFGTQPLSFAVPDPDGAGTIMLDMALSEVAGTRVAQMALKGLPIPPGWLIGPDGEPATTVDALRSGGALTSLGGHKGYGLGALVEIMAGVLAGAGVRRGVVGHDPARPSNTGHWIMATDPTCFMSREEFNKRLGVLREEIHAIPTATGVPHPILPGEPETLHEADTRQHGLELDGIIWDDLHRLALELDCVAELEASRQ